MNLTCTCICNKILNPPAFFKVMTTTVSKLGPTLCKLHDIEQIFKSLMKGQNKIDVLIFEILELKPILNKQCESKSAKLFVYNKSVL